MTELKQKLYDHCREYLRRNIETLEQAITDAQESSQNETKSSAGDKYETGRAMAQQEIDRNKQQLAEALKQKNQLERINPQTKTAIISDGSLIITDSGGFYVSISAGQVNIDDKIFFLISPASPIAQRFKGLKANDSLQFNGKTYVIKTVS
ncbi:3-oxoacyl-ACP synthase [Pedobacter sp. HMF7647]|uniref:3-oxoacyl-ACP synthase n=1 Tax=Hufsiella arboris TaxID=2695275 RepID=A0A7K1Y901_9SPHI|nr:3-oxoacyl-ACP synthase [Hufsiella arboris]MXV50518.1 3-oxoacyl-ACP synthase [Hufsiella arboris]